MQIQSDRFGISAAGSSQITANANGKGEKLRLVFQGGISDAYPARLHRNTASAEGGWG